jgi:hypothetical protein
LQGYCGCMPVGHRQPGLHCSNHNPHISTPATTTRLVSPHNITHGCGLASPDALSEAIVPPANWQTPRDNGQSRARQSAAPALKSTPLSHGDAHETRGLAAGPHALAARRCDAAGIDTLLKRRRAGSFFTSRRALVAAAGQEVASHYDGTAVGRPHQLRQPLNRRGAGHQRWS